MKMSSFKDNPNLVFRLPTKNDVLDAYNKMIGDGFSKDDTLQLLASIIIDTWTKADCPCFDKKIVKNKLLALLKEFKESKREPRESHRKKKPRTNEPTRKSAKKRDQDESSQVDSDKEEKEQGEVETDAEPVPGPSSAVTARPQSRTRASSRASSVNQWQEKASRQLFDILSQAKINSGDYTFDEDFYNDQKGERTLWIEKQQNPEYKAQLEIEQKRERNVARRRELAMGETRSTVEEFESSDDDFADVDLCDYMEESTICTTPEVSDRPSTRSSSALSSQSHLFSTVSVATQTSALHLEDAKFPKVSTRKASKVKGKEGVLIDPKILECIVECETTARCSLAIAIEVTQIVANRIFGQNWLLPLSMDKDHLRDVQLLKRAKKGDHLNEGSQEDIEIETEAETVEPVEEERAKSVDLKEVEDRVSSRKKEDKFRLPSMTAVRNARQLISIATEQKIAEEMLQKECAIIPDGTGRKIIGKVGGAMLQVGGKMRALPFQIMGNETWENWAKFIDHVLSRMAVSSEIEKKELWHSVLLFIHINAKQTKYWQKKLLSTWDLNISQDKSIATFIQCLCLMKK